MTAAGVRGVLPAESRRRRAEPLSASNTEGCPEAASRHSESLLRLAITMASAIDVRAGDVVEVYLRSRGPSGALVYGEHSHPGRLITAIRTLGRPSQEDLLTRIAAGVPTTRQAVKADESGNLSLFQAVDLTGTDLVTLCEPLGCATAARYAADAVERLRGRISGWGVESPASAHGSPRVRCYTMLDPAGPSPSEKLADLVDGATGRGDEIMQDWRRWSGPDPVVVNLELTGSASPPVKLEFPNVSRSDLPTPAGHEMGRWRAALTGLAERLTTDRLSHLGVRYRPEGREWCGYVSVLDHAEGGRPR